MATRTPRSPFPGARWISEIAHKSRQSMAATPHSPFMATAPGNSISQIMHPGARELDLPNHASIHGSHNASAANRPQYRPRHPRNSMPRIGAAASSKYRIPQSQPRGTIDASSIRRFLHLPGSDSPSLRDGVGPVRRPHGDAEDGGQGRGVLLRAHAAQGHSRRGARDGAQVHGPTNPGDGARRLGHSHRHLQAGPPPAPGSPLSVPIFSAIVLVLVRQTKLK
jgi:hypothetical protein